MTNIITESVLDEFHQKAPEFDPYRNQVEIVLEPSKRDPYSQLLQVIIYQQLTAKSAESIYKRFIDLLDDLEPDTVLQLSVEELRSAGLSRQKAGYIRNVAHAFRDDLNRFRTYEDIKELSSDDIMDKFTKIKGVGEWTVQMYLLFALGRLDVVASHDLGIKKGVQKIYSLNALPTPAKVRDYTSHWQPLGSIGSLYCWKIQELV